MLQSERSILITPHSVTRAVEWGIFIGSFAEVEERIREQWAQRRFLYRVIRHLDGTTTMVYACPRAKLYARNKYGRWGIMTVVPYNAGTTYEGIAERCASGDYPKYEYETIPS